MNRTIPVSTEVFAAIWAARQAGEETEDAILRRILQCPDTPRSEAPEAETLKAVGYRDQRNGVEFPEGFEIFRTYKHREYKAKAHAGAWVRLDNSQRFVTLNQLNASIAVGAENVWNGNWKYRDSTGAIRSIGELRGRG
ncbi:MAG: hypothetical protein ACK4K8_19495 [Pannonibacter sp.]